MLVLLLLFSLILILELLVLLLKPAVPLVLMLMLMFNLTLTLTLISITPFENATFESTQGLAQQNSHPALCFPQSVHYKYDHPGAMSSMTQ